MIKEKYKYFDKLSTPQLSLYRQIGRIRTITMHNRLCAIKSKNMKKLILTLFMINSLMIYPCTTFVIKTSTDLVFGRNLDWVSENGIIVVNKRNQLKTSIVFPPDKPVKWISKYGSITFNQFGKELPFGGINEKGLVIEIMVANAEYPDFDQRKAVNELQWVQYQLDNASTIEDIIENDKIIRLSKINQDLHFLVCDKNGNTAVIEFKNKKMVVYRGDDLPYSVLENSEYLQSLKNKEKNKSCRFTTASNMVEEYNPQKKSVIDYSFDILDNVKLDGSWSIVYDIKNMKIYFKTKSNKNIRIININSFDFECGTNTKIYDLLLKGKGNINKDFIIFNSKINREKMENAVKLNKIFLPEEILDRLYNYHKIIECNKQ